MVLYCVYPVLVYYYLLILQHSLVSSAFADEEPTQPFDSWLGFDAKHSEDVDG